ATTVSTPLHEVVAGRRGVCQDFAHLQLACLRSIGLAARYVSGYVRSAERSAAAADPLVGADASHAWVSLWCGSRLGWVDLDPTNNMIPTDGHVVLAWGRDYGDVTPLRGVILGGGEQTIEVAVHARPTG
ncbi:MAG: transglutaminase family protein, partial [Armatimonadia bacterium]|nr:transglutaminase family protein [Armatimonadia bacterium]